MINRILMELYDDYENNNLDSLIDFVNKTFPKDGTDKLFIGCVLILFSRCNGFKPRYSASRENLYNIVLSAKEKVNNTNLLAVYVDKINTKKGINRYLKDIVNDENLDKYADVIIEWLGSFKNNFIEEIKKSGKIY